MIRGMFAYGFIINLPDKYNAKGGRESTQLSGGRKQIVVASCIREGSVVTGPKICLLG